MELNRAVCIDMPEVGIPWFHGEYCQHLAKLGSGNELLCTHMDQ